MKSTPMSNITLIIQTIDDFLTAHGKVFITAVEAAASLDEKGILKDSKSRPGKPLRDILRAGKIPHAYQDGVYWKIPHSETNRIESNQLAKSIYVAPLKPESHGPSDHKLELIAILISKLLNEEYGITLKYGVEYSPSWLTAVPNEDSLIHHWSIVKDVYSALTDGILNLENQLNFVKISGSQKYDIWFNEPFCFAVEFDESQHFNQFRGKTLNFYNQINYKFDLQAYKGYTNIKKPMGTSGFQKLKCIDPMFPEMYEGEKQDNRMRQRAFRDF
ncbi:MAG: hypothetical protein IPK08_15820 [Bacteroidetes bacterium]|nr:hypothetical protein [Bacteroidota bacterium]